MLTLSLGQLRHLHLRYDDTALLRVHGVVIRVLADRLEEKEDFSLDEFHKDVRCYTLVSTEKKLLRYHRKRNFHSRAVEVFKPIYANKILPRKG